MGTCIRKLVSYRPMLYMVRTGCVNFCIMVFSEAAEALCRAEGCEPGSLQARGAGEGSEEE